MKIASPLGSVEMILVDFLNENPGTSDIHGMIDAARRLVQINYGAFDAMIVASNIGGHISGELKLLPIRYRHGAPLSA